MVHRVQRIGVAQLAKVMGLLYFLMGIVFLVFFLIFSRSMPGAAGAAFPGFGYGMGMLVFMPLLYACLGLVFGALTAALYNVVAGMLGGIELDLVTTGPSALP
jgi:hypothetical protein